MLMAAEKKRENINLSTFLKISDCIRDAHEPVSLTYIRDKLKVDHYSVKIALNYLIYEKKVGKKDKKYFWRGGAKKYGAS